MNSRRIALKILLDMEVNKGYSNLTIRKYLNNCDLGLTDRAFVTEIVYGVIEKKIFIDYIINKVSKIKVKKMSNYVKIILRMGVYELFFLNTSSYAAVNEAAKLAKKYDRRSLGFVNGVLRNIDRKKDELVKNLDDSRESLSVKYSISQWIADLWIEKYGIERTASILKAFAQRPKIYVRVNHLKAENEEIEKYFERRKIEFEKIEYPDGVYAVRGIGGFDKLDIFKKGKITVQDVSSMLPVMMLNPQKGDMALDVCSAPGGKTMQMAEMVGNSGKVSAHDLHEHKIELIKSYAHRMGFENVESCVSDATQKKDEYIEKFDSVLVDVPCSGLGIIRRKPEIKYKSQEEIKSLPEIQYKILENSSKYLKKGGFLVYSTCTLNDEENENVVRKFLENNSDFETVDASDTVDFEKFGASVKDNMVTILPDVKGFDGFFSVKLRRKSTVK